MRVTTVVTPLVVLRTAGTYTGQTGVAVVTTMAAARGHPSSVTRMTSYVSAATMGGGAGQTVSENQNVIVRDGKFQIDSVAWTIVL